MRMRMRLEGHRPQSEERVQRPVTQTLAVAVVVAAQHSTAAGRLLTSRFLARSLPRLAPPDSSARSLFSAPLSPLLFFLSSLPHTRHKHRILVDQTPARNGHITATGIFAGVSGLNALRSPRSSGTRDHLTARSSIPSPTTLLLSNLGGLPATQAFRMDSLL